MKIVKANSTYIPEKLIAPFGFKGGYMSELWQVVSKVETANGVGIGVGVQSVLWSDEKIFLSVPEKEGNSYMYKVTEKALELLVGREGGTPIALVDSIWDELVAYAKSIVPTGDNMRETFVRNALVSVDNALWQAYSKEVGEKALTKLIPVDYRDALSYSHDKLCNIPLISYGVSEDSIKKLLDGGSVLLKIKIGFDNSGKMTKDEMVEWDKRRLKQIHDIADTYKTEYTKSGKILYYLDANGKYDTVDRVKELIDYAETIGAKERIILLEEPLDEYNKVDVSSIGVRIAADESVHSAHDVEERISLGYGAITLKPIAKTLSETLKILKVAVKKDVPCFCADLTVNPLLVEWNKNIASRIKGLPEMNIGVLESNGEQNYQNWDTMYTYLPSGYEKDARCKDSLYNMTKDFFNTSGGIFDDSEFYKSLFE